MVWKLKVWWAWQDREHEEWLAAQSRQGLHLRRIALLGLLHRFERGAPGEVVYRWDFKPRGGQQDYRQLFTDAGWQMVGDIAGGWLCWRKAATPGSRPEIFTDSASLQGKYRTQLMMLIGTTVPLLPLILANRDIWRDLAAGGATAAVAGGLVAMGVGCAALGAYGAVRIWQRMREVRVAL